MTTIESNVSDARETLMSNDDTCFNPEKDIRRNSIGTQVSIVSQQNKHLRMLETNAQKSNAILCSSFSDIWFNCRFSISVNSGIK